MAVSSKCTQIFWMKPHTQYLRIVTYTNQIFLHRAATTPCPTPCKKVYVANKYRDPWDRTVQLSKYTIYTAAHFVQTEASMEMHLPKAIRGPRRLLL